MRNVCEAEVGREDEGLGVQSPAGGQIERGDERCWQLAHKPPVGERPGRTDSVCRPDKSTSQGRLGQWCGGMSGHAGSGAAEVGWCSFSVAIVRRQCSDNLVSVRQLSSEMAPQLGSGEVRRTAAIRRPDANKNDCVDDSEAAEERCE